MEEARHTPSEENLKRRFVLFHLKPNKCRRKRLLLALFALYIVVLLTNIELASRNIDGVAPLQKEIPHNHDGQPKPHNTPQQTNNQ